MLGHTMQDEAEQADFGELDLDAGEDEGSEGM